MREWIKRQLFKTCPKTGRIVGVKRPDQLPAIFIPFVGLIALAWYVIRVAPKPSRAAYPCQQVARPLAGSFLVWLVGMGGATVAFRHAGARLRQARFASAGLALIVGVVGIAWAALSLSQPAQAYPVAAVAYTPHPANSPIGVAKGLLPGRVVWTHDPQVTSWNGATTAVGQRWYDQIDQSRATSLMQSALAGYADATTPSAAWGAIFRHFNGGASYQSGEKIFVKVNLTTSNSDGCANSNYDWNLPPLSGCGGVTWTSTGNSPQLIVALLDQLVNVVGVEQSDISIGDPTGLWVNELYNKIQPTFPNVKYLDARGTLNRTHAARSSTRLYWSAPANELAGKSDDYIQQAAVDAKYIIDLAVLKSHERNGITGVAKNHFGSLSGGNNDVRKPTTSGYYNIHLRLPLETEGAVWPQRASMGQYRPLVDLNGHSQMGGKTLLYMLDGIYGGRGWASASSKWGVLPFCATSACATADKSWPGSLLVSMDPVAIDSVAFDLLSLRTDWTEVLAAEGVQDYLHEMALADNPPSGTFYDPEGDGTRLASMGVHEHWNNASEKKYSRNLGTGNGIELLYMPRTTLVRRIDQPIAVDGVIDAAWAGAAQEPFGNIVLGSVSNAADLSGKYRALYDDTNLYLLVEITDEKVMTDWSPNWFDDDCIEIMIDGDYSRGTSYDHVNDFELGWRWDDLFITPGANSAPTPAGVTFNMAKTTSGWLLETALPLAQIGTPAEYGRLFGLDVHVNDDDDGGARDAKMTWKAQVDDSWQYPYRLGAGRLVGPAASTLSIRDEGEQLRLAWTHMSWNTLYELYRSDAPYFTPSQSTLVQDFNPPTVEYLDTPPAGPAWYYVVRGVENGLGIASNYAGRFTYTLSAP